MAVKPQLGAVQETLLLPLIGRAWVSRKHPTFFTDEKAVSIYKQLEFDKKKAKRTMQEGGMLGMAVRALKFDKAIKDFVYLHPEATIVNVGAGLDTAFWRVDNGKIKWIDLDLPDSMALRDLILPPSDRNPHIAKSVFDLSWIDDIGDVSKGLFIQIPGVLPYIEQDIVETFFREVPDRLPGAHIIFDTVSEWGKPFITQGIKRSGMSKAVLRWGINDARTLVKLNEKIQIVRCQPFFEDIQRKSAFSTFTVLTMNVNDRLKLSQIMHLKFKE